jgi:multiple sugar transport system permease protein
MAVATVTRRRVGILPRTRTGRSRLFGYILLTPALLYIFALVGVPFLLALYYSVSNVTTSNLNGGFVGLKNFRDLLQDPAFRQALGNTFVYTVFSIVLNTILGTFLAFILMSDFVGKRVIRFLILLPWTIPIALTILSWKWMLDSQYSVINWLGSWKLPLDPPISFVNWAGQHLNLITGPTGIQWLGQPKTAMASVIIVNVWRTFPFSAIILLAGLTSIPSEIIDAARLDGAGPFTRYRAIIVPMIAPILFIGLLFNLVFTITDLTIVYLLTLGGPAGSTEVLGTYAFKVGINSGDLSHGAATTLFLFPVLFVFSIFFLRQLRKREL